MRLLSSLSPPGMLWVVFGMVAAQAQSAQAAAPLGAQIQAIAAQHHGDIVLFAEDLKTHQTVAISPDTAVQTASVIKLAILYEALEQVRGGKAHFDDRITLTAADQVPGSGVLQLFDAPLSLTLKDALTMMIVMSDNSATNMAIDRLGLENIDRRIVRLGLKDPDLYKKVFTPAPAGTVMPADQKRFGLGKTTAREMAMLMAKIGRCELAEPGSAAHPAVLPNLDTAVSGQYTGATSDSIANTTGALDAVRNDVAAISTKNGMVIISVFTLNNKDHSWGAEQEGELTIAKLARAIIQSWSPEGLAAWPAASGKAVPAGK